MNTASKSFSEIYNKMPCIKTARGSWVIHETSHTASFNTLTVSNASHDYDIYDTAIILKCPNPLSKGVSSVLQDRDCDGMALVAQNDGKRAIVLVELKSGFTKDNLFKAYQQLVFSLLKVSQMLYLCDDFSLSEYAPIIIIACHGIESDDKMVEIKDFANKQYQKMKLSGKFTFFGKCLPNLLMNRECSIFLREMPLLGNLPLHPAIGKSKVRIILTTAKDSKTPNATYNLTI